MTRYATAEAFRSALETRIKAQAQGQNIAIFRKRAAFAAFLKRVRDSRHDFALKGGFAMMLRFDVKARPSKDMDFVMRAHRKTGEQNLTPVLQVATALEEVVNTAGEDFFGFQVKGNPKVLRGAGYGSWRFQIEAKIGNRRFESFHIDIALGDAWIDPMDEIHVSHFQANGESIFRVRTITQAQQFAEKLHAYTLEREGNSRVKDLVDMVILILNGLSKDEASYAVDEVFTVRGTHTIPSDLDPPPPSWEGPYNALAATCGVEHTIDQAFMLLSNFKGSGFVKPKK